MKTIQTYQTKSVPGYTPTTKEVDGKTYVVVPVVMIREGVHNGSRGAIYHSQMELVKTIPEWEGKPVVIDHPQDLEGNYISANSTGVKVIGYVNSPVMVKDKLQAFVYFDTEATPADLLEQVNAGKIIEVSVGVYSDEVEMEGEWNGEKFKKIAVNEKPDHLAILPNDVGACSVQDGCGIRIYKRNDENMEQRAEVKLMPQVFLTNSTNWSERMNRLHSLVQLEDVRSSDNDWKYHYLEEVWESYVIYEVRESGKPNPSLRQRAYQVDVDGKVKWTEDEPVEVQRKVFYVKLNTNKSMTEKCNCPEKVNALIANAFTHLEETDRGWLSELTGEQLDRLVPKPVKPVEVQVNADQAKAEILQSITTIEDLLKVTPEALKETIQKGVEQYQAYCAEMVKTIMTNAAKDTWTEDELNAQPTSMLEKLGKSYGKPGNYSGQAAGAAPQTNKAAAPILMPLM